MVLMNEREAFEEWAGNHWRYIDFNFVWHSDTEEYAEPEVHDAWEAWQAAAEWKATADAWSNTK